MHFFLSIYVVGDFGESCHLFPVLLRPQSDHLYCLESVSQDLKKGLDNYANVISSKLPNELPAKQSHILGVGLEKEVICSKSGVYRLSIKELKN